MGICLATPAVSKKSRNSTAGNRSPPLAALNSDLDRKPRPSSHGAAFTGRPNESMTNYSFTEHEGPGALTSAVGATETTDLTFLTGERLAAAAPLSPVDKPLVEVKQHHGSRNGTTMDYSYDRSYDLGGGIPGRPISARKASQGSIGGTDYDNIFTLRDGSGVDQRPRKAAATPTPAAAAAPAPAPTNRPGYFLIQPREESPVRAQRPVPTPPSLGPARGKPSHRPSPPEEVELLAPCSPERRARGASSAPPAPTTAAVAAVQRQKSAAEAAAPTVENLLRMSTDSYAEGYFSTIPAEQLSVRERESKSKRATAATTTTTSAVAKKESARKAQSREPSRPPSSCGSTNSTAAPRSLLDAALSNGVSKAHTSDGSVERYNMSASNFHSIFGSYFLGDESGKSLRSVGGTGAAAAAAAKTQKTPTTAAPPHVSDEAALQQLLQSAVTGNDATNGPTRSHSASRRQRNSSASKADGAGFGTSSAIMREDSADGDVDACREIVVTESGDLFKLISAIHQTSYAEREPTGPSPKESTVGPGGRGTPRGSQRSGAASPSLTEDDEEDMVVVEFRKIVNYQPTPARETPTGAVSGARQKDNKPKRRVSEAIHLEEEDTPHPVAHTGSSGTPLLTFAPQRADGGATASDPTVAHHPAPNSPLQHMTAQQLQLQLQQQHPQLNVRGLNNGFPGLPFGPSHFNRFAPMHFQQPLNTRPHASAPAASATPTDIVPRDQNPSSPSAFNSRQQKFQQTKAGEKAGALAQAPTSPAHRQQVKQQQQQRRISGDADNLTGGPTHPTGGNTGKPHPKNQRRVTKVIFLQKDD